MLVILDRDGVINDESENYIKNPEEWVPIPNSLEAIIQFKQAGWIVTVATNQSGVGRGYYTLETLHDIHSKMQQELISRAGINIDKIYFCPHLPEEHCLCRKPKPGMLENIALDYPDLFHSAIFVGDSERDIVAAQAAGCMPVLVKTGHGTKTFSELSQKYSLHTDSVPVKLGDILIFDDLAAVADYFVRGDV